MIQNPQHALVLGALNLIGSRDDGDPFWFETIAEGTDLGNPVANLKAILSFLQDGSIESIEGFDNRETVLMVTVCGWDSAALAAGELALMAELRRRNTLTWTPPDDTGPGVPCVFDVVTSFPEFNFDDLGELRLERTYKLTIKALPFPRTQDATVITSPAPPNVTPTVTSIDACTSTTGWAGSPGAASVYAGTAVRSLWPNSSGHAAGNTVTLTRTGLSASMTSTPYLRLDFTSAVTSPGGGLGTSVLTVTLNGTVVSPTATNGNVSWYLSPATTLTSVSVSQSGTVNNGGGIAVTINDLSRSDQAQDQSGARQVSRTFDIAGSVRSQVSIALGDPTASLGSVLVYTSSNTGAALSPPLRTLRVSGSTETTDTSLVSGKYSDLSTNHIFDLPASNVPAGPYLLMARVKHATTASYALTWAAKSRMGSTTLDANPQTGTQSVALVAATWKIAPVATMVLPTRTLGSAGVVRIELSGPSGVQLDEAWLFNVETGCLTQVECGTGTPTPGGPSNRVFIDAPSLDTPVYSVSLGNAADRSDAFGAGDVLLASDEHEFVPPSVNVFAVNTNAVAAAMTLTYFPRSFSHVA